MGQQIHSLEYKGLKLDISLNEKKGSDVWIVCLHGLQSNKALFRQMLDRPFYQDLSYIALDFVGFGNSSKPDDFSYDLGDQSEIIEQVIKDRAIPSMHLIGHSMGGMVQILLLDRLGDSVLSCTNLEGNLTIEDAGTSLKVSKDTFEDFKNSEYPLLKKSLESSQEPSASLRREALDLIPDYAFYKSSQSIVEWSKSKKLLGLFNDSPVRKLFVYGDANRRKTEFLAPSIQTAEIPNAGHFMLLDNLNACCEKIEDFIRG